MANLALALKAARELGISSSLAFLRYQIGLRSGWYRLRVRPARSGDPGPFHPPHFSSPPPDDEPTGAEIRERAAELLAGQVRLFGALKLPLDFSVPPPLRHWTRHQEARISGTDIKFYWEPARFGWVADLVRAQCAAPDDRLAAFFARRLSDFMGANPPYQGPHWASGQEAALRLIHIVFAAGTLKARIPDLGEIIALHAARIPPTLIYARAQNNNHLLSEAAGLFTAGVVLPEHPRAAAWRDQGWRWFQRALQNQIEPDGTYTQHSTNYHRLVLTLALWVRRVAAQDGRRFPGASREKLAAATRRLLAFCDPATGRVPNLGANDGTCILPLSGLPFHDYRPVLQAAARAFLAAAAFPPGPWDEMAGWLGVPDPEPGAGVFIPAPRAPDFLPHPDLDSRISLRAVKFKGRPGHADQLHVDLWWRGLNVALDPGTYLYNGEPPWENALGSAQHHNTVTIDGRDQMTRAGRFLYVDRAQARGIETNAGRLAAEHDGYRRLGLRHRRTVAAAKRGWVVRDEISGRRGRRHRIRLHWLLPDWDWKLEGQALRVHSPEGWIGLSVTAAGGHSPSINLVRAGGSLLDHPAGETMGWFSPTYGVRLPALSYSFEWDAVLPVEIESAWNFNGE